MARKISLAASIRAMKIGDILEFPIKRYSTVQSTASREGLIHERVYSTETIREDKVICVKRIK